MVTAYFTLAKSKHSLDFYVKKSRAMLGICATMVVFADDERVFAARSEVAPTCRSKFIRLRLNETQTWLRYHERVDKLMPLEAQRDIHSTDLILVWQAKMELLDRVARENPFRTRKFMWVDIGSMRNPTEPLKGKVWPSPVAARSRLGTDGRFIIASVSINPPCGGKDFYWTMKGRRLPNAESIPAISNTNLVPEYWRNSVNWCNKGTAGCFLAGALFGGEGATIQTVFREYVSAWEAYIHPNNTYTRMSFDLTDQHTMVSVLCARPHLFEVVMPWFGNGWFFLYDYLS